MSKCYVCDDREAVVKILVTKLDGEVYDDSWICLDCAQEPASELCLCLPPKE
jgi:protein-arginine kinase activator protein McsA